ncbi:MAG TPA: hypothetical protein VFY98_12490 [Intrasporangium sp.]|nr:hypothetical protein [Intrasporangium sp.]
MNSFTPLLFIALLYLALEIRNRRSAGGPRWRPGEDLRSDRDEARRIADLAAAKTRRTPKRRMHTVVS